MAASAEFLWQHLLSQDVSARGRVFAADKQETGVVAASETLSWVSSEDLVNLLQFGWKDVSRITPSTTILQEEHLLQDFLTEGLQLLREEAAEDCSRHQDAPGPSQLEATARRLRQQEKELRRQLRQYSMDTTEGTTPSGGNDQEAAARASDQGQGSWRHGLQQQRPPYVGGPATNSPGSHAEDPPLPHLRESLADLDAYVSLHPLGEAPAALYRTLDPPQEAAATSACPPLPADPPGALVAPSAQTQSQVRRPRGATPGTNQADSSRARTLPAPPERGDSAEPSFSTLSGAGPTVLRAASVAVAGPATDAARSAPPSWGDMVRGGRPSAQSRELDHMLVLMGGEDILNTASGEEDAPRGPAAPGAGGSQSADLHQHARSLPLLTHAAAGTSREGSDEGLPDSGALLDEWRPRSSSLDSPARHVEDVKRELGLVQQRRARLDKALERGVRLAARRLLFLLLTMCWKSLITHYHMQQTAPHTLRMLMLSEQTQQDPAAAAAPAAGTAAGQASSPVGPVDAAVGAGSLPPGQASQAAPVQGPATLASARSSQRSIAAGGDAGSMSASSLCPPANSDESFGTYLNKYVKEIHELEVQQRTAELAAARTRLAQLSGEATALAALSPVELEELHTLLSSSLAAVRTAQVRAAAEQELVCPVCWEHRRSVVFQCGHQTCRACSDRVVSCPICRQAIQLRINTY